MVNEEKVILMTKASLCETKEAKKKLKIAGYFRHDYISLQLLYGWFFARLSFVLCGALWAFCNMEYLLDNIHKMDLREFVIVWVLLYVCAIAVYSCILYAVCSLRYRAARKSAASFSRLLQGIQEVYEQEEKNPASGNLTEET